jgi:chemotaxis protein CheX
MSTTIEIESGRAEIAQIVYDVFQTMLSVEVSPLDENRPELAGGLTAMVQFLGDSKGAVLLHCTVKQAIGFTSRMLGEEPERLNDDVRDVLGELANVVGGNLKSLFSPGVALSLPMVAEGKDHALHLCESQQVTTVCFASELGAFQVSLARVIHTESKM